MTVTKKMGLTQILTYIGIITALITIVIFVSNIQAKVEDIPRINIILDESKKDRIILHSVDNEIKVEQATIKECVRNLEIGQKKMEDILWKIFEQVKKNNGGK